MSRATLLMMAALAASGCAPKTIDPCAGEAGACLAVQVEPSTTVERIDAATVHVVGDDGLDATKATAPAHGGAVKLPAAVALAFGSLSSTVSYTVDVTATLGGQVVGGGSATATLSGTQHATIRVTLTPDGVVAPMGGDDMAMPDDAATVGPDLAPPTCTTGTHLCNGSCASDTSVDTCGTSCAPCPVGANATAATCDGTSCGLACATGFHLCGGACVSDTSVQSCNMSCTACTAPVGGTATCDGMSCGGSCPTGQKLCVGACIPTSMACNGSCPTGTHDCNGNCFDDTSVNSCGTSCTPCAVPANATNATCTSGACGFVCNSGYKICGSACIPSTGCCTTADCTQPANGTATCNTTTNTCTITCNGGYANCGGVCKNDTSTSSCGPSCSVCTAPTNATPTCNGTSCDFACNSGYVRSGSSCVACGAEGQTCCANNTCGSKLVCSSGKCQEKSLAWSVQTSGTVSGLNSVWISASGAHYVSGFNQLILTSTNGTSWTSQTNPLGTSGNLATIWGSPVSGYVYAVDGSGNVIYNRGGAWEKMFGSPATTDNLSGIWADANENLFIGTGSGGILTYNQSGQTWSTLTSTPAMNYVGSIWGSGSNIYAVGNVGASSFTAAVAHSKDGGKTWTAQQVSTTAVELFGVWGSAATNTVYAVGKGIILKTTLGSDTWTAQTVPAAATGKFLYGVWGSDQSGYIYIVGQDGIILHSIGNGTWVPESSGTSVYLYGVWGNPAGTEVIAVGDQGVIVRGQ